MNSTPNPDDIDRAACAAYMDAHARSLEQAAPHVQDYWRRNAASMLAAVTPSLEVGGVAYTVADLHRVLYERDRAERKLDLARLRIRAQREQIAELQDLVSKTIDSCDKHCLDAEADRDRWYTAALAASAGESSVGAKLAADVDVETLIGRMAGSLAEAHAEWSGGPDEGYWVHLATSAIAAGTVS